MFENKDWKSVFRIKREWLTDWKFRYGAAFAGLLVLFLLIWMLTTPGEKARKIEKAQEEQGGLPPKEKAVEYSTPMTGYALPTVKPVPNIYGIFMTIQMAQGEYITENGRYGSFVELAAAGLLDGRFASPNVHINGYTFSCVQHGEMNEAVFEITATPDDPVFPVYKMNDSGAVRDAKNCMVYEPPPNP